ncbi:unnamed protein product, partial [Musa banksii]
GSSILLDDAKGVPFLEFLGKWWCALVPLHLFSVQLFNNGCNVSIFEVLQHILVDLPTCILHNLCSFSTSLG